MQRITADLVRKRCEHNEGDILSLEELSLHQEDLGKLEHLQNWCKELKILLLQNNLISKIENVGKLKQLEYINFALNNIEKIENLEGCESLQKLDFTLNFIGDLTSVESLKGNIFLESLFLTGNPCSDYFGYKEYVIAALPQLKMLDGNDILRSERIQALQNYDELKLGIEQQQEDYFKKRQQQRMKNWYKVEKYCNEMNQEEPIKEFDADIEKAYWDEKSDNSPETRIDIALKSRKNREVGHSRVDPKPKKRPTKYFKEDGIPYNMNQGKFPFVLDDDTKNNRYVLDITIQKYLDTNLIETDVQPNYVRVTIKKMVFQYTLQDEVNPDRSKAYRSTSTGHLVVEMPKVKEILRPLNSLEASQQTKPKENSTKREFLDVKDKFNLKKFLTITPENTNKSAFEDNPDVPPLE